MVLLETLLVRNLYFSLFLVIHTKILFDFQMKVKYPTTSFFISSHLYKFYTSQIF